MVPKNILMVLLNANGDCLYGTVIAKQIKEVDYPGCHLTWVINANCKQSIVNNPFIDKIWEVKTKKTFNDIKEWIAIKKIAEQKKSEGEFDLIFYLQIHGENVLKYDGGIRSSIYKNYPHPIVILQQPIVFLRPEEINNVTTFSNKFNLAKFKKIVLVECGPTSFTSNLHPDKLIGILELIIKKNKDIVFILSSNKKIEHPNAQIIDGSELSFRENAELIKYCDFFIGCSSGITWLTTTQWAKNIPKIILTNPKDYYASSFIHDQINASLPIDNVIEIQSHKKSLQDLKNIIELVNDNQFEKAKNKYHTEFRLQNFKFIYHQCRDYIKKGDFVSPIKSFRIVCKRNHFSWKAVGYLIKGYLKAPVYLFQKEID